MSLGIEQPQTLPLKADRDGVIRIRGTRVTLDTVVAAFRHGATAEEIAQQYPTASLADVYSVIGYYLQHEREVTAYLAERSAARDAVRGDNERRFDPQGVRDRLTARKSSGDPSR